MSLTEWYITPERTFVAGPRECRNRYGYRDVYTDLTRFGGLDEMTSSGA